MVGCRKMIECKECNGTGRLIIEEDGEEIGKEECPDCEGIGEVYE